MIDPTIPRKAPPRLTYAQQQERVAQKRALILTFLASGEVYTSADVIAEMLSCNRATAFRTLEAMESAGLVKSEIHEVLAKRLKVYGVTPHGLAHAGRFDAPFFELGRTNPSFIRHRLDGQRMRLRAERAGWRDWQPERALRESGLKKVPDAAAIAPNGERIAVEIERHCKTPKRYQAVILSYLQEMKAGRFQQVHFVCPDGVETLVQRAFEHIPSVKFMGETVKLEAAHRARFSFYPFSSWPPAAAREVSRGQ